MYIFLFCVYGILKFIHTLGGFYEKSVMPDSRASDALPDADGVLGSE